VEAAVAKALHEVISLISGLCDRAATISPVT